MYPVLKTIIILLGWVSTGLITGSMLYWKFDEVKENKWNWIYLAIFGMFVVIDIIINFVGFPQMFSPGLAVYMVGNLMRHDEWPNDPKFTEYHKIYILILGATLTSSLILITFSDLTYVRMGLFEVSDFMGMAMASMTPWILPAVIILLGADPTNRYGNRDPNRIIGGLLPLLGIAIAMVIGFLLMGINGGYILDIIAIVFSITALASSTLIFLAIFVGNY